jgi:hypothetical protein
VDREAKTVLVRRSDGSGEVVGEEDHGAEEDQ